MFSADNQRILTASDDYTARLWSAADGSLLQILAHSNQVWQAVFSPDGRRIITASAGSVVRIWDAMPESRSADRIGRLISCFLPFRFDQPGNKVIVPTVPQPAACNDSGNPPPPNP